MKLSYLRFREKKLSWIIALLIQHKIHITNYDRLYRLFLNTFINNNAICCCEIIDAHPVVKFRFVFLWLSQRPSKTYVWNGYMAKYKRVACKETLTAHDMFPIRNVKLDTNVNGKTLTLQFLSVSCLTMKWLVPSSIRNIFGLWV